MFAPIEGKGSEAAPRYFAQAAEKTADDENDADDEDDWQSSYSSDASAIETRWKMLPFSSEPSPGTAELV
jgi:hypothetical protein